MIIEKMQKTRFLKNFWLSSVERNLVGPLTCNRGIISGRAASCAMGSNEDKRMSRKNP
jgi:hypothetical protein